VCVRTLSSPGDLGHFPISPSIPLRSMLGYHATRLRRSGFSSLPLHSLEEKPVLTQTLEVVP
ncbi:MAG: hypothetical protein WCC25_26305, partial [Candidatus Korobacteraceae bacterium]